MDITKESNQYSIIDSHFSVTVFHSYNEVLVIHSIVSLLVYISTLNYVTHFIILILCGDVLFVNLSQLQLLGLSCSKNGGSLGYE